MNRTARQPANARELAFVVLDEHKRSEAFVAPLLDTRGDGVTVSGDDRRLAAEIVFGVVRRQATLDALLAPHVRRGRHQIEGPLWTFMQIGVYQLVFMDGVPPHAALNETVKAARRLGRPRWTGFLNGTLRSAARNLTDELVGAPAAGAVPLTGGRYRLCRQPVFPDPAGDPLGYAAQAFSFPRWLIDRWGKRFDFAELARLGFWFNEPAKIHLRVNRLRTPRDAVLAALREAGIDAEPGRLPESVLLAGTTRVEQLPGFADGWFTVQDETAMRAARLLAPRSGETVLDLCAAPGTKTTHLAELMENQGRIVATDAQPERLARVEENCRRLGIGIVEPRAVRADSGDVPSGPFDAVLLDVPCSNTGVLGKRPEARWRLRPSDIEELSALQRRLLSVALDRLKPGGRLVYSTCSIEPEENRGVVERVLEERGDAELVEETEHLPGRLADGGYQALVRHT
jgi:16S rRNA (cytosine967-C5)-methyltransferase